mgnify:CR=1 FL=1
MGDMIRWIKCIFKDCKTEDKRKDHEAWLEEHRKHERAKAEHQH